VYYARLLMFGFLAALCAALQAAEGASAVGRWTTIDDNDNKPRSVIRIYEENGEYKGAVEQVFKRPHDPPEDRCEKCPGDKKDKPVVGMVIMWGLKDKTGGAYEGGNILDPDNGKTYRCKMKLSEDGKKLAVRGFIGVSLLGRTQTWLKAE
jgi:uncharacterized protein (DUF2147 family)